MRFRCVPSLKLPNVITSLAVALIVQIASQAAFAQEVGTELIEAFTEPYRVIDLAAAEAGILESIVVEQGDVIAEGDVIANLNNEVLLAQLEIAKLRAKSQGPLKRAIADVAQKRRREGKLAGLHRNGHASEEEIDAAKSNLEIAEAGLLEVQETQRLSKLDIRQIEAQLRQREIRSPVAGQVIKLEKDEGEYVASIEPVVARVVQLDKLRVKFYIDTLRARSIHQKDRLPIVFLGTNKQVDATVEFVSPTTDADSRTVRVEVVLDNQKGVHRAGVPVRLGSYRQARK